MLGSLIIYLKGMRRRIEGCSNFLASTILRTTRALLKGTCGMLVIQQIHQRFPNHKPSFPDPATVSSELPHLTGESYKFGFRLYDRV